MIKALKTELKKNLYLPYFLLGIVLVICFCFMADAVRGNDGRNYSVFEIVLLSRKLKLTSSTDYAWISMWAKGFGSWLRLIVPVIVSSAYVMNHTEERKVEHRYFLYSRESRLRFVLSKTLGAAFSAGLILAAGYVLFGVILLFFFPQSASFSEDSRFFLEYAYGKGSVPVYILKIFLGSFMYGIYASLFTVFLSIFISDRYVLLSIPVLFQYAVQISINKLFLEHMFSKHADKILALDMTNILRAFSHKYWWHEFAGVWILLLMVVLVYYLKVKKEAGQ